MSKVMIGVPRNGGTLRTNIPTSEKFTCQAYEDQEKKKKERNKLLINEMDKREEI